MQLYIILFTIFSITSIVLTYFYENKLTNYTRTLYNLKPKKEIQSTTLFSFLPKKEKTKKSIWQKMLILGAISSIVTFLIFVINYEEPSVYYQAEQIKTIEDFKQFDPFRNTNFIVYTIMFFSFIIQTFVLMLCYAQLFQNLFFITLNKIFKGIIYIAKAIVIKMNNIITKQNEQN